MKTIKLFLVLLGSLLVLSSQVVAAAPVTLAGQVESTGSTTPAWSDAPASANTALLGFAPTSLTVRTGQSFYLEVVVDSVTDLYAWQAGASFNTTYFEFLYLTPAIFLTQDGVGRYFVPPVQNAGVVN